jgi:hypothetical protein
MVLYFGKLSLVNGDLNPKKYKNKKNSENRKRSYNEKGIVIGV